MVVDVGGLFLVLSLLLAFYLRGTRAAAAFCLLYSYFYMGWYRIVYMILTSRASWGSPSTRRGGLGNLPREFGALRRPRRPPADRRGLLHHPRRLRRRVPEVCGDTICQTVVG